MPPCELTNCQHTLTVLPGSINPMHCCTQQATSIFCYPRICCERHMMYWSEPLGNGILHPWVHPLAQVVLTMHAWGGWNIHTVGARGHQRHARGAIEVRRIRPGACGGPPTCCLHVRVARRGVMHAHTKCPTVGYLKKSSRFMRQLSRDKYLLR